MKVLVVLSSVLLTAFSQNVLNVPGIDAWRAALEAHAAAEGRLYGISSNLPAATSPQPISTSIQGLPQWQMHQANVLAAERALESQVQTTVAPVGAGLRVFATAPPISTNTVENSPALRPSPTPEAGNSLADAVKSSLAKFIGQVQKEKESKLTTTSRTNVADNLESTRPDTFLDKLLDSFAADKKAESKEEEGVFLSQIIRLADTTEKPVEATTEQPKTVLSELLGLLDKNEVITTEEPKNALEEIIDRLESEKQEKTTEKNEEKDSLVSLIELLSPKKSTKTTTTTTTTETPSLSLADILGILEKQEEIPKNNELAKEIDEFLDILEQIDPSLATNEVETESERSEGRKVESDFITEELSSAAEESEILNAELEELLNQLEEETQRDLEFIEETYRVINSRLNKNINLQDIVEDDEFVNSVFHRFAVLGIPLRREDVSIQALLEAKKLVTENVLAAAEESKRIAIEINNDLQGKLRREGRALKREDMFEVEKRLKTALKLVQSQHRLSLRI